MSIFFNMLGIDFESYGHVLGLPRVSSDSEKNKISPFFKPFFNGLIKKFACGGLFSHLECPLHLETHFSCVLGC